MRGLVLLLLATIALVCEPAHAHGLSPYSLRPGQTTMLGTFPFNTSETGGHLTAGEAFLGAPDDMVLQFVSYDTWANARSSSAQFTALPFGTRYIYAVGLTVGSGSTASTPLASVAAGSNDSDFVAITNNLLQAQPYGAVIIRLGWEMNGPFFPWYAYGNETSYIAAFNHVAALMKAQPGGNRILIIWNPNRTAYVPGVGTAINPATMYPGDAYVDAIGQDVYFQHAYDSAGTQAWSDASAGEAYGLTFILGMATAHNKLLTIPEWGIDSDSYSAIVPLMAFWLSSNNAYLADYWDSNEGINCLISSGGALPNTAAAFITAFGAPTITSAASRSVSKSASTPLAITTAHAAVIKLLTATGGATISGGNLVIPAQGVATTLSEVFSATDSRGVIAIQTLTITVS